MACRAKTTKALRRAVAYYYVKKNFSCHKEVGLTSWGKLLADLVCFNYKGELVIVEIKSCWADYSSDTKWHKYLPFADKMYFAITEDLFESKGQQIINDIKQHGIGLFVHCRNNTLVCKRRASVLNNATPEFKNWLFLKLAWRKGKSRANTKRIKTIKYVV
tara:strand:- start:1752 stop:2234 length:483 start_codon:yes stop_codon:yes gene_type:complete